MSELFQTDRTAILRHINNIYKNQELGVRINLCKNCTSSNRGKKKCNPIYSLVVVNLINQNN